MSNALVNASRVKWIKIFDIDVSPLTPKQLLNFLHVGDRITFRVNDDVATMNRRHCYKGTCHITKLDPINYMFCIQTDYEDSLGEILLLKPSEVESVYRIYKQQQKGIRRATK